MSFFLNNALQNWDHLPKKVMITLSTWIMMFLLEMLK